MWRRCSPKKSAKSGSGRWRPEPSSAAGRGRIGWRRVFSICLRLSWKRSAGETAPIGGGDIRRHGFDRAAHEAQRLQNPLRVLEAVGQAQLAAARLGQVASWVDAVLAGDVDDACHSLKIKGLPKPPPLHCSGGARPPLRHDIRASRSRLPDRATAAQGLGPRGFGNT